jgi:predicted O-linked N-acetylglucosamine transferase (SPINDLY family)
MSDLERAAALWRDGEREQAEREVLALLATSPEDARGLEALAEMCAASGRMSQSVDLWRKVAKLRPEDATVLRRLAQALIAIGAFDDAIAVLRRAAEFEPDNARGYNNLGIAQLRTGEVSAALSSFERAVAVDDRYALGHMNRGIALGQLGRPAAARASLVRALELDPHLSVARTHLGQILAGTDPVAARREQERALESEAINLMSVQRPDAAVEVWTQLIERRADLPYLTGHRFHCHLHCADWTAYEETTTRLEREVLAGRSADLPFSFFVYSRSPQAQLRCSRAFVEERCSGIKAASFARFPPTESRIRIAYLSADFHEHPTAYLIAGLLETHDRSRFEVTALSYGLDDHSPMRARLAAAVEHFVDVQRWSDAEVAEYARREGIQIAVDLKGHTGGARIGIFARRAAPLQVNFLGYPGTLAAPFIDYIVADRHVIPGPDRLCYTEKVIYLPHSYQPNDPRRPLPGDSPSRSEHGLPDQAFVFCCFNNLYKVTPQIFAVWLDLLRQVPGAVLWLLGGTPLAIANLRRVADTAGVAGERLVFARHVGLARHLARYRRADLFLDTTPCNAHTTASDALWMGVPVVTLTGPTFVGRVATSLLHAVGLPELCTNSLEAYQELVLRLARSPQALRALKDHLERVRATAPLFDIRTYCLSLETAYEDIWARYSRGEPAADVAIEAPGRVARAPT